MYKVLLALFFILPIFSGCSGVQTFPNAVRAGETAAIGMGWQKKFKRSNTTVTITPSNGNQIVYQPNDPAIRAIINLYPDPVSWLVVGTDTQTDVFYNNGYTYGNIINSNFTNGDHDWWQTTAFIDLPIVISPGIATIAFSNSNGDFSSSVVEIVSGSGVADDFNAEGNGPLNADQLSSLERAPNFEVSFTGPEIPYAMELKFSYMGDLHVVNPRASKKNIIWSGDGLILNVMLLPAKTESLNNFNDFKFYITGQGALQFVQDAHPITLQSIEAFDINGNKISGVGVSIDENIN